MPPIPPAEPIPPREIRPSKRMRIQSSTGSTDSDSTESNVSIIESDVVFLSGDGELDPSPPSSQSSSLEPALIPMSSIVSTTSRPRMLQNSREARPSTSQTMRRSSRHPIIPRLTRTPMRPASPTTQARNFILSNPARSYSFSTSLIIMSSSGSYNPSTRTLSAPPITLPDEALPSSYDPSSLSISSNSPPPPTSTSTTILSNPTTSSTPTSLAPTTPPLSVVSLDSPISYPPSPPILQSLPSPSTSSIPLPTTNPDN